MLNITLKASCTSRGGQKHGYSQLVTASLTLLLAACSGDYGPPIPESTSTSATKSSASKSRDAGTGDAAMSFLLDASSRFAPDAFFINDPAPPMCSKDGKKTPPPKVEGSADCPADKNREGCECKGSAVLAWQAHQPQPWHLPRRQDQVPGDGGVRADLGRVRRLRVAEGRRGARP
jgi:hypothetical protein